MELQHPKKKMPLRMTNVQMEILDIIIMLFFLVSIIWTFKSDKSKSIKDKTNKASNTSKEKKIKKPTQVPATTSEDSEENIDYIKLSGDDHKRCNQCKKVICIKDNFCSHCGQPNP